MNENTENTFVGVEFKNHLDLLNVLDELVAEKGADRAKVVRWLLRKEEKRIEKRKAAQAAEKAA